MAPKTALRTLKVAPTQPQPSEDEDEDDLEDSDGAVSGEEDEESDESESAPLPIHESLLRQATQAPRAAKKYVPADETKEQRDARTIFIGNLPSQVVKLKVSPILPSKHTVLFKLFFRCANPKVCSARS